MKTSTCVKFIVVAILGICSSLLTSQLLARSRSSRGIMEKFSKSKVQGQAVRSGHARRLEPANHNIVARARFNDVDISGREGTITVNASASLLDSKRKYFYMWNLMIQNSDSSNKVVFNLNYDQQIFSLKSADIHYPTFKDEFRLDPGNYRVQLRLFRVGGNSKPNELKLLNQMHPDILLSMQKTVILPR